MGDGGWAYVVLGMVVGIPLLVILAVVVSFFKLWIQALFSGAPVSLSSLVAMRLRKVSRRVTGKGSS